MRTYNLKDLERRWSTTIIKPSVTLTDNKLALGINKFNKKLSITIPGEPIADSRPRHTSVTNHMYNTHKANLMKVFKYIYDKNDILQNVCILGPVKIEMKVFITAPKTYTKKLNKTQQEAIKKENMYAVSKPDNDNFEKVHFDVLQDINYMIFLRDEAVMSNTTNKIYVYDKKLARVEIDIFFSDKIDSWYWDIIKRSKDYLKFTLSPKYMKLNKLPENKWKQQFFVNLIKFHKDYPTLKLRDTVRVVITKLYNNKNIYYLSEGKNIEEAMNNLLNIVERMIP